ncbi:erythrocyte membrane-associated antigen, putative [Plasmodium gallinaceum]|uniref:Erythrocyte membrane-associated antigen, putative n=1 Tax=Plasmodium gallinaceum TaxID=5849 RepID=A0A1J1H0N1_PLAGA|nr:erythrocyte membrane-associated antigen, putative [Plasmodium gallinaceum]CRG98005.1 erythrocyte membrane-associated antigen, putative [Plasmodium gallinaceum]
MIKFCSNTYLSIYINLSKKINSSRNISNICDMVLRRISKFSFSHRYMYIFSFINVLNSTLLIKPKYTYLNNTAFISYIKNSNNFVLRSYSIKKNYNALICKSFKKYRMNNKLSNSLNMDTNNENENILNDHITSFNKNNDVNKNFRNFNQNGNPAFSRQYNKNRANNFISNNNYVNNNKNNKYSNNNYSNNYSSYLNRDSNKNNEANFTLNETKLNTNVNYINANSNENKSNYIINDNFCHISDNNLSNNTKNNFNKDQLLLKNVKGKNIYNNNIGSNNINTNYLDNSSNNINYKNFTNEKNLPRQNLEGNVNNNNLKGTERFSYLNDNYQNNVKYIKNSYSSNKKNINTYNSNVNVNNNFKNNENSNYMENNFKRESSESMINNNLKINSILNLNDVNTDLNNNLTMKLDTDLNDLDLNDMVGVSDVYSSNNNNNNNIDNINNDINRNNNNNTLKLNNLIKNRDINRNEGFDNNKNINECINTNSNGMRGMLDNSSNYNNRNRNKIISHNFNTLNNTTNFNNNVNNMNNKSSGTSRMNNMVSPNNMNNLDYNMNILSENERNSNNIMNKHTRNISYDKTNNYSKDINKINTYETKKNDNFCHISSSNNLKSINNLSNKLEDQNNGNNINKQTSISSPINLDADACLFYDFNDFLDYMYKDENILTLFYIRKNYLKAESREEFVNENDKIKYSIVWAFSNDEKISVVGSHNTKKLSKKVCVKKILLKLKNISLLELDQMTKWMINSLNVILKVENKNIDNKLNNNMYYSNIEWKINNKIYKATGVNPHEKIAEMIATQKLYMLLYDIKDQLIKESEYTRINEDRKMINMHNRSYENNMYGRITNNNHNYDDTNVNNKMISSKCEPSKNQTLSKNYSDTLLYKNNNNNISYQEKNGEMPSNNDVLKMNNNMESNTQTINNYMFYNINENPSSVNTKFSSVENSGMQSAAGVIFNRNINNMEMNNVNNNINNSNTNSNINNMNYQNNNLINSNDKNSIDNNSNGINNSVPDSSEFVTYSLTKQDASSIQMLRNNIASRYKIHQTEIFEQVYNLYKCTLEWEWKNGKNPCKAKSVGYGSTKSLAKCEAAYDMLVKNNLIEYVSSTDRKNAQYIRDLIAKDLTKALNLAIQFILQYSSSAWSIFLIYLLRELLIDGNYDNINRLLNTVVEVSKQGRLEVDEMNKLNNMNNVNKMGRVNNFNNMNNNNNNEEQIKDIYNNEDGNYSNNCSNSFFFNPYIQKKNVNNNYVHKLVSIDLWEKLIDECVVILNDKLCFHCITLLQEVELDYSIFISKCAHDYYKKYRIMLALELQANLAQSIQEKRDFEYLHENKSLLLKLKSITMPILSFTCTLTNEEKEWMKSTQMREDDIVLLKPYDMLLKDEDAWSNSLIGSITSTKNDNTIYNINIRIFSAENTKKGNVKYNKYKLYLLLNIVTHERMLQALRSITFISSIPTQYQSPYVFTPEIRFLILHTYNKHSKYIAQNGKLSDEIADYERIKMDFQNNESLKNSQEDILSDYNKEAKNPYEDLLNEALNKQIDNTHVEDIDKYLIESINLPTNLPLNDSQKLACLSALTRRLTLVQGPPGTGKTHVACAIIDSWHRQNSNKKILAVADSNVAANNLVEGLKKRNIQAVRVGAGSDSDFHEEAIMEFHRYKDLLKLRKNNMQKEAKVMKALLFLEAVKKYNVVIATCVGSGHEIFDNEKFERVIIDECAQSIEPSNLIPLGHYCNNLVLIGDHKQLPPTIISPDAIKLGLDKSLLERFVMAKISPVHLLTTQRRMHLSICVFPNFHFYDNKLKTANVTEENRPIIKGFLWPNPKCRLAFIDVSIGKSGSKFENAYGTSKFNLYEIEPLISVLKSIINEGCVSVDEIGILTAYDAQKMKLKKAVQEAFPYEASHRIEIDSIDGFQGKEKDLILFSAVRSNANNELGFLRDARRLNVMLTRAKRGVIIFGDQFTLANDTANWLPWLKWISSKRAIVHVTKLNDHLENTDYSLLDKLNKINKAINLKNITVSDNYYYYGNDMGFSNDYSDPNYTQNEIKINSNLNLSKEGVEHIEEEIVENWEDLL